MGSQKDKTEDVIRIGISLIRGRKDNPRVGFDGEDMKELSASIKEKGVISPILVRPRKRGKALYELVYGERRLRASRMAGLTLVPAIVRKLTDAEAFDLMTIENLQRENLSPMEEAQSFKDFLDRRGDEGIRGLAERTGLRVQYIRKRANILTLPKYILKDWQAGRLALGHLEQLLRVKDKALVRDLYKKTKQGAVGADRLSVAALASLIDSASPLLSGAPFDIEGAGCLSCQCNSDAQRKLFDTEITDAMCLKPTCFRGHLEKWLDGNWQASRYRAKYKTNGYRFSDEGAEVAAMMYSGVAKACGGCPDFITIIRSNMDVESERVCIGEIGCYRKELQRDERKAGAKGRKKQKAKDTKAGKPRVEWHGKHFREAFYQTAIPERIRRRKPNDIEVKRLGLFSLLKSNRDIHAWFAEREGIQPGKEGWWSMETGDIFILVQGMDAKRIEDTIQAASIEVVLQDTYDARTRRVIANTLGIELAKEWAITPEYLAKKTKPEILQIGKDLGVFEDPKAQAYLYEKLMKKRGRFESCKKSELVALFLESGVDLIGRVPGEILAD